MILPEEIINDYPFDNTPRLNDMKQYLIHHYNAQTLKQYQKQQTFMTKDEIMNSMPMKIVDFFNTTKSVEKKPVEKTLVEKKLVEKKLPKEKFWADELDQLEAFRIFVDTKYEPSTTPDLKFKDLMTAYNSFSNNDVPCTWSAKYDAVFKKLDIKIEKVQDPRYARQGGSGTCYVLLCPKGHKKIDVVAELPNISNMSLDDNFNRIPFIPIPK